MSGGSAVLRMIGNRLPPRHRDSNAGRTNLSALVASPEPQIVIILGCLALFIRELSSDA